MASMLTPPEMRGVNVVVMRDGREIHLDDITTAAEGQAILDELDAAIDGIEHQMEAARRNRGSADPDWYGRANVALRRKRRVRDRLQRRIGELRRAERQAPARPLGEPAPGSKGEQRWAFLQAAQTMLDHELMTEVWVKAKEMYPAAFKAEASA